MNFSNRIQQISFSAHILFPKKKKSYTILFSKSPYRIKKKKTQSPVAIVEKATLHAL